MEFCKRCGGIRYLLFGADVCEPCTCEPFAVEYREDDDDSWEEWSTLHARTASGAAESMAKAWDEHDNEYPIGSGLETLQVRVTAPDGSITTWKVSGWIKHCYEVEQSAPAKAVA